MNYDLSNNDRFFLNQLIPMWDAGKTIDLQGDLKYVFHREKGTNYNPAQFEYTLKTLSEFIVDHGFARDAGRGYSYTLQPKANMLLQKGTIEQFEQYLGLQKGTGFANIGRPEQPKPAESAEKPATNPLLTEKPGKFAAPANIDLIAKQDTLPVSNPHIPPPPPSAPRRQPETSYYNPAQHKENKSSTSLFSLLRIILAVGILFLLWYFLHGEN